MALMDQQPCLNSRCATAASQQKQKKGNCWQNWAKNIVANQ